MPGSPKKRARREAALAEAKKAGRPSMFKAEYSDQAYKLCLLGATDVTLGEFFGVSEKTINVWKGAHPEFKDAIKRGKDIADAEIAAALYHRAKGYEHPEDDIRTVSTGQGGGSEIVITPTTKHYPPDTQAASLWLRNRQPHLWKEKQEVEVVHLNALHLDALRQRQIPSQPTPMVEDVTPKDKPGRIESLPEPGAAS